MKRSVFYIADMDCPTEEQLIRNRLSRMSGVQSLEFDLMKRRLTVMHTLDDEGDLLAALESLRMGARLEEPECRHCSTAAEGAPAKEGWKTWVLMGISGTSALAAELVGWRIGETGLPVIALALVSISTGGVETLQKALRAVRTFTLNINFLMALAVVGAIAIGKWPEAAMVTFLFALAELIEAHSLDRARNAISALMDMAPETATVQDVSGEWREVSAADVEIGQMVRVKPGERIPLDGIVTSGVSTVNQAPITGESLPVEKERGDSVFAGSINGLGSLEFEVTANKGSTTLDRIIEAVQEAQAQRAPTQRFVDSFARYYTPAVVVLAILVAAVPPLVWAQPFMDWLYRALVLLVIACPCALVISTPVTVVSGLAAAARSGILVKGGAYLEEARKLKAIAFDKTGTLTHGKPVVTDVVPLNGCPADELLQIAASLNSLSEHPIASAIVARWTGADTSRPGPGSPGRDAAVKRSGELLPVTGFESLTGRGVRGQINGGTYYIGNHRLCEENGVCGLHVESVLNELEAQGKSAIVLSSEQSSLAVLGVSDTVRHTSAEAVKSLHNLGLRTVLLTGDNQRTAEAIASQVGIHDVKGDLLPEDKLAAVDQLLERYGHIGMVGDGINDAPALAKATVGFAMGAAGTDTALETADVALMEDDLRKVAQFLRLSRATTGVLWQNITLAIGIKIVFFVLAVMGTATLWMAVFADMGASLLVVFNGLRLLRFNPHRGA